MKKLKEVNIVKVLTSILSARELYSSDKLEVHLMWTLFIVGYIKQDQKIKNQRIAGWWLFGLFGLGISITHYNKEYKHEFYTIPISRDVTHVAFDNKNVEIDDWKCNIDMTKHIKSVSGYIDIHGKAVVGSIQYYS